MQADIMFDQLKEADKMLLADETRAFAFLATTMPDGTPQVTPVWFNHDGEHILVNSAVGRKKDLNMRDRPSVALCIMDLERPYRYLQVRGEVVEITEENAYDHIRDLNKKYHGKWEYPRRPGEVRVTYKILPGSW